MIPSKYSGGFPGGSVVKNSPANAGDASDVGSIPGSGRSPGVGNGNPLQYSCLGNPMDSGVWWGHKESDITELLSIHTHPGVNHLLDSGLPWKMILWGMAQRFHLLKVYLLPCEIIFKTPIYGGQSKSSGLQERTASSTMEILRDR